MKACVGTKIVKARPMSLNGKSHGSEVEHGYLVEYPDGYVGWNKKEEFERCSRELTEDEKDFVGQTVLPGHAKSEWEFYITTKILELTEAVAGTDPSNDAKETKEDGYFVRYPNNHQSWSPKIKADQIYREINQQEYNLISDGFADNS
jgi:hypothetical protein